ncbi:general substrate transporter [Stereum hirsutum FP-91666 SS1]|uniref:general substrate transporter n=1 Tax=Stereum hirsutum (strain FP-91666) TaxID=721885 RepID=UPI000440B9D2|nr:general substrate transporter [Stereum hirsutum FP-91666 SS1]EIM91152.1 general substrate transporter [Stereum hirsutum FP-91666 SS1]
MGLAFNIFVATFCSIGSFLFGGIISSVLTFNTFLGDFDNPSPALTGAIVSTFTGGCFFGSMAGGWISDRLGRKIAIQIGAVIALWGCAMQTGARNIATLFVGRVVGGLAIGLLSMTVPLYNTEVAPPKIRGFLVGLTQQMLGIGFIVANWVGYGCQYLDGSSEWRLPLGLQMAPAFLLLVGIQFLPQSPRWLLEQGRDDEAREVIYKLHDVSTPEAKAVADADFLSMSDTIKAELLMKSKRVSDLWADAGTVKRSLVAIGVQVFGQFTGVNVINYYGPRMYASLGIEAGKLLLIQGIYGAVGPITNFIFITLILDTVGRKKPLLFGCAANVALFSVLAAILASFPPGDGVTNFAAQRAGIGMIFMLSIVFSLSFGPVSWVLASEVFPTRTRAIGTAAATCANWAMNVLISEVAPIGLDNSGYKFYILFIVLNAVDFIVILWFFPETKGKSLEDMAIVFGDKVDPREILHEHGRPTTKEQNGKVHGSHEKISIGDHEHHEHEAV